MPNAVFFCLDFGTQIVITDFPETLKKLVFNDCYVQFPSKIQVNNFFTGMDAHFADLEVCNQSPAFQ